MLAAMSPDERLGQLFMLSYGGDQPTPLLLEWIRKRGLGGIKIFGWNAEDTGRLAQAIAAIQEAASQGPHDVPPFVATDQEGGWIRHVKGDTSITPGNMAIGASAYTSDAYDSAYYIGLELSALGITMNFAPTVDLATRPDSTIIGPRAFSSDPTDTAILAAAWAKGMADAGVAATAKHFPGHGDTELDSHGILPVISIDMETLWNRELVPYRLLAAEGVAGVMSGHLAYPAISGAKVPASLSPLFLKDILRGRIGFEGLVITDDLMMAGAWSPGGLSETCELAVRAGNDILMFSKTIALQEESWLRLSALYKSDPVFRARVDESALRVIGSKLRWLLPRGRQGVFPSDNSQDAMQSPQSQTFFDGQAMRSATMVGADREAPAGRILLAAQFPDFFTEAAVIPAAASWSTFRFSYQPADSPKPDELSAFRTALRSCDSIIICVANEASAMLAKTAITAGKRVYVVSVLSPVFALDLAPQAEVLAVYSYAKESFRAAFRVITEQAQASGRLPFVPESR